MKTIGTTLLMILLVWLTGCPKHDRDQRAKMLLDSEVSGKNVTIVRAKEAARPDETVTDLKDLTTIMQSDLEAKERTASKEVVYVKPGEPARPAETRQLESK